MTILFFTATGNSLSVAKTIGGKLISIPRLLHDNSGDIHIADDEGVGIVFPVYFGNLPNHVRLLLGRVRISAPYKFAILTYGELAGRATSHLVRTAREAGIEFNYVRTIKMVDNNFSIVNVEKQVRTQGRKHIAEHMAGISEEVRQRCSLIERPNIIDRIVGFVEERMPAEDAPRRFSVEPDKCMGCGTCTRVCPNGNLGLIDGKPSWGENCLKCTACYHNCPHGAIRYKGEKSRYTFRNDAVSLGDIIYANSNV